MGLETVSDLIGFDNMIWKVETVEANFSGRDVRCILDTPLSATPVR